MLSILENKYGTIPLETFNRQLDKGLQILQVQNINNFNPSDNDIKVLSENFLWLHGKWKDEASQLPGWHTFMEKVTCHLHYLTNTTSSIH